MCTAYGDRVVGGELSVNELDLLAGGSGSSLRATRHAYTDADRLEIKITLRQDYRQDLADFDGRSFDRFRMWSGIGERVGFETAAGVDDSGFYRQSYLSAPASLPNSYEVTPYPYDGGASAAILPWLVGTSYRTSVVRWPVYLKDMAWYLF